MTSNQLRFVWHRCVVDEYGASFPYPGDPERSIKFLQFCGVLNRSRLDYPAAAEEILRTATSEVLPVIKDMGFSDEQVSFEVIRHSLDLLYFPIENTPEEKSRIANRQLQQQFEEEKYAASKQGSTGR